MGFWEGKCFFCLYWGTLIAIIALSINSEVKEQKRQKQIHQYKDTTLISYENYVE